MTTADVLTRVLAECAHGPVLLDLGAAAGPPPIWLTIAAACDYVAFEPDPRSHDDALQTRFRSVTMIHSAATIVDTPTVELYLTRSRFCSSTLVPEGDELRRFAFAPLFEVDSTQQVPATTIDRALQSHALDRVHWFKADTQGTDLRLFQSMTPELRAGVLAVDVEPGLIAAYRDEDTFTDVHQYFTQNGFWLSSMDVGTNTRGSQRTLARVVGDADAAADRVPSRYRRTPVCCEARYLRELTPGGLSRDDLAMLATFAALDAQPLFALEAIDAIPEAGRGAALTALAVACAAAVRGSEPHPAGVLTRVRRRLGM